MAEPYVIGVIHARGGSKRIPLKNIKPLKGLPLVAWIVRAAKKSAYLDRLLISSDHPEIIRVAKEHGAEAPFVRPADLSEDVPSELVTKHAVEFVEKQDGRTVDIAVTFQPTTPLCSTEDIDACVKTLVDHDDLDSAFTAKKIHERPEWMFRLKGHHASLYTGGAIEGARGVFQSLEPLYMPNGAAYASRRNTLFCQNRIIGDKPGIHVMPPERSVDIDEPIDFLLAETLVTASPV
jgi:CMP-N,N'-diacetyllegionaminic acid synthase